MEKTTENPKLGMSYIEASPRAQTILALLEHLSLNERIDLDEYLIELTQLFNSFHEKYFLSGHNQIEIEELAMKDIENYAIAVAKIEEDSLNTTDE